MEIDHVGDKSMILSDYTCSLLDDIENRINPEAEEDYLAQWKCFWNDEFQEPVFSPKRKNAAAPKIRLKNVHINDALHDFDLMLAYELEGVSKKLAGNEPLSIRANYGTGIMTSLFGAPIFEMPREMNTLPTTRSFNDSDKIREILDGGMPDLFGGFGGDVLRFGEYCSQIFEKYPKIKKYVKIYHPDTQGPLDIAELLWGSEMFYEMYDDTDFVHGVMRLITDTYKAFLDKWYSIVPKEKELSVHWGIIHRGNIMLRLDSAMNLSPDFYNEFSKPYDRELFDHFGGGCLHFCGRGDHYVESACEIESLYGFNISQPHLNDMSKIFAAAERNNKKILQLRDASYYAELHGVKNGIVYQSKK